MTQQTIGTYGDPTVASRGTNPYNGFRFTAPPNAGSVASFKVSCDYLSLSPQTFTPAIYTDAGGSPGTRIGSWGNDLVITGPGEWTFTFPAPPSIAPGLDYWLVFATVGVGTNLHTVANDGAYGSGRNTALAPMNNLPSAEDWKVEVVLNETVSAAVPAPLPKELLATYKVVGGEPAVNLINPDPVNKAFRHYRIEGWHVLETSQLITGPAGYAPVLTVWPSFDGGLTYRRGQTHYKSPGLTLDPVGHTVPYNPQQHDALGMRIGVDYNDSRAFGHCFTMDIRSMGTLDGQPLATTYNLFGYQGFNGPPQWATGIWYAGHFDGALGQQANAFSIDWGGADAPLGTPKFAQGYFELWGEE